jgi:hypothetical protein
MRKTIVTLPVHSLDSTAGRAPIHVNKIKAFVLFNIATYFYLRG